MVRTDSKTNLSGVTDLKEARIKKNLARLTELVNSSPETKARTLDYIMAKSNAERQAEFKAKAKETNKKQLNYFISLEAHNALTTLATDTGKTKIEILESLLLGKDSGGQAELDRLNAMADTCFQCVNWQGEKCNKGLVLTGFCCADFESLRAELATAKAKILELQNQTPEPEQQQGETSEPLNLTPDKVFKYDYYGEERLIAWFNDDYRVFVKDKGKRWGRLNYGHKENFTEKEGRFYFGTTEIQPVENFKGKLPKTLIMR